MPIRNVINCMAIPWSQILQGSKPLYNKSSICKSNFYLFSNDTEFPSNLKGQRCPTSERDETESFRLWMRCPVGFLPISNKFGRSGPWREDEIGRRVVRLRMRCPVGRVFQSPTNSDNMVGGERYEIEKRGGRQRLLLRIGMKTGGARVSNKTFDFANWDAKATLCIHTDKVQQKDATLQQNCIAEKVFDLVKFAIYWGRHSFRNGKLIDIQDKGRIPGLNDADILCVPIS
ncbi:Chaperone J-domain superfamily [Forsythia ovata]|uniref:Chaperone J-domain superfamily n=1 Tax=Forsythia ovata TaxID=205694 RepID=A0ABD1VN92_9LAMI